MSSNIWKYLGYSVLVFTAIFFVSHIIEENRETTYCGKVVKLHESNARSIYRYVIFYSEDLGRNITVEVTNNTYFNTKVGENVCFSLNVRQLRN